jgi:hypothetical protein
MGFAVQFLSSVWWRQNFISIVDHRMGVRASNRTAIQFEKAVV